MDRLMELLEKNWSVVSQAPLASFLLGIAAFGVAYAAAAWKFSSQIEQLKSANETLRDRIQFKTEQSEVYRERALKYDDKLLSVAQSDSTDLREKTFAFVREVRAFIERHRHRDDQIQRTEWVEMTQAGDESEKNRLWHKFTSAMSQASSERNSEWERRFKVDALVLRDELLSRAPEQKRPEHIESSYEHPVNYFGFCEVADDLERMAKLLQRSGV